MGQEELVDSVIADATIYNPGGPHLGAFPGPLLGAFRHNDDIAALDITEEQKEELNNLVLDVKTLSDKLCLFPLL